MFSVGDLLVEVVKFIDICQQKVLTGKLDIDTYFSLTECKIDFIETILKDDTLFFPNTLLKSINEIYSKDFYISNLNKKIVGK